MLDCVSWSTTNRKDIQLKLNITNLILGTLGYHKGKIQSNKVDIMNVTLDILGYHK